MFAGDIPLVNNTTTKGEKRLEITARQKQAGAHAYSSIQIQDHESCRSWECLPFHGPPPVQYHHHTNHSIRQEHV
ncbi:hypothetical protein U9M48_005061 [Paspalum notatum var. saurae]|uniref:Uncharacterized protein n=1 Tax=Paspalum notatum var. saurae TaxID=547442 RepID=A0AAQ3PRC8_PASNO